MILLKAWATQQLIRLSTLLANAFGFGDDTAEPVPVCDTWTPEALARFGLTLGKGFNAGL
jgi:hypothetical protein